MEKTTEYGNISVLVILIEMFSKILYTFITFIEKALNQGVRTQKNKVKFFIWL